MLKYRNRILLGALIALIIYVLLLFVFDNDGQLRSGLMETFQNFPVGLLILVAGFQVVAWFFRFWEWHYFLGVIDARDKISVFDSMIIFVSGFAFVISPGKVAELLKSVFLKIKTGVPVSRSAPVVVAERVVDGIAVILILCFVIVFAGEQLRLVEYLAISQMIVVSSGFFILFALIAVQIRSLAQFCLSIVAITPILKLTHRWFSELYVSTREIFDIRHIIPTVFMGIGVYLSSTLGFIAILYGFGLSISLELCLQALLIVGVASAVGAVSLVPNGAGVTEVSNTAMLMAIVAPQYPQMTLSVAIATAILQGFFHKWFRVFVGLIVMVIFRNRLFGAELDAELRELQTEKILVDNQ